MLEHQEINSDVIQDKIDRMHRIWRVFYRTGPATGRAADRKHAYCDGFNDALVLLTRALDLDARNHVLADTLDMDIEKIYI